MYTSQTQCTPRPSQWASVELAQSRGPSQYPKRRLIVRSREVSKPRDLYLELSDRSEIWQALRQHCCRCACQISKRFDYLKNQSRGFEISRDLTIRRLFGYWDGAQTAAPDQVMVTFYDQWLKFDCWLMGMFQTSLHSHEGASTNNIHFHTWPLMK